MIGNNLTAWRSERRTMARSGCRSSLLWQRTALILVWCSVWEEVLSLTVNPDDLEGRLPCWASSQLLWLTLKWTLLTPEQGRQWDCLPPGPSQPTCGLEQLQEQGSLFWSTLFLIRPVTFKVCLIYCQALLSPVFLFWLVGFLLKLRSLKINAQVARNILNNWLHSYKYNG